MSHIRWFVVVMFVVLALAGAAIASAADPVTVTLNPLNDSGESGTATLTDLGNGKVKVEVTITGAPAGVVQPMHIHKGTCANLEAKPTYPLTSLTDGKSVTVIEATLADLQNGNFAINGHKSAQEASIYV
ncbi:MAG: CHRD domain-containing protein, partial [Chloroflexi bacterium]|nr:CHRD domain-containing protein [Chloroflexota bacterium]